MHWPLAAYRVTFLVLAVPCVLPLVGCAGRRMGGSRSSTAMSVTVVVERDAEPAAGRDPLLSAAIPRPWLRGSGLMRFDAKGKPVNEAARQIFSPDGGRSWEVRLRAGWRLADGSVLTSRRFCDLWKAEVAQRPASRWLWREIVEGPLPVSGLTLRFTLAAPHPDFPRRLAHPSAYVEGSGAWTGVRSGSPRRLRLIPRPAAGGLLLLRLGDADLARLTDVEIGSLTSGSASAPDGNKIRMVCARGADTYVLLFNPEVDREVDLSRRARMLRGIESLRLAQHAAPASGRPLPGTTLEWGSHPVSSPVETAGTEPLPLLVEKEDEIAAALADRIQAGLLDDGTQVRVDLVSGDTLETNLRDGRYTFALARLRSAFHEPALDLAALMNAAGLHLPGIEGEIDSILMMEEGRDRERRAHDIESRLRANLLLVPMVEVDECWAHLPGVDIEAILPSLTTVSAGRFLSPGKIGTR